MYTWTAALFPGSRSAHTNTDFAPTGDDKLGGDGLSVRGLGAGGSSTAAIGPYRASLVAGPHDLANTGQARVVQWRIQSFGLLLGCKASRFPASLTGHSTTSIKFLAHGTRSSRWRCCPAHYYLPACLPAPTSAHPPSSFSPLLHHLNTTLHLPHPAAIRQSQQVSFDSLAPVADSPLSVFSKTLSTQM